MKIQRKIRRSSGFTLVELLIVIAIIAVLAGLGFAGFKASIRAANSLAAKNHVTGLKQALDTYYDDYTQLPDVEGEVLLSDDSNELMAILVGANKVKNPKGTAFFSAANAKGTSDGIVRSGGSVKLYDPWGEFYRVVLDDDYDQEIEDPFGGPDPIYGVTALVYSAGEDKELGTRDDVKSWE